MESPPALERIAGLLREGKNVTIIVEDTPVGGFPENERAILTALQAYGAEVYLSGDRYRFHHGKYEVSDNDTLFITTENRGANGFPSPGTSGNRGWGAILEDSDLSRFFADLFYQDLQHSKAFSGKYSEIDVQPDASPYTPVFGLEAYDGGFSITPLVAPEDAAQKILGLIDSANSTIYVEQFYIYKYV
jgi:phosphatidylserine/phosphatidylglycerophosphate/cardiolipin synthase-like enzyme